MAADRRPPPGGRLESWKEIAAYLGRGVSTVQRWEREEGLPVRRHQHRKRGSAFALREEIDEWWRNRSDEPPREDLEVEEPRDRGRAPLAWGAAVALSVAAGVLGWLWTPAAVGAVETLVVLPFSNSSGDPGAEYLADGLTEALIDELSAAPDLKVMGRATAFRYKGSTVVPRDLGRSLGADAVLSGRVVQSEPDVEVIAELVRIEDGSILWRRRYAVAPEELSSLPRRLGGDIGRRLGLAGPSVRGEPTVSDETYKLCLRGRFFWNQRTTAGLRQSIEHFRESIRRDEHYAEAWRGLADAYNVLPEFTDTSEEEAYPAAMHAAKRALALDPGLAGAHASLAFVLFWWERDAAGAEQSFRRALELNPRHATAHHWFGNVLLSLGRGEEGLDHLGAAHDADPLSLIIGAERGAALYHLRRYGEAEAVLRSTLELGPGFGEAHYWLTRTLLAQGDARAALEEARTTARLFENPAALRAEIGIALERSGRREGALEQVRRLEALRGEWPVAHDLALLYAELGLHEQACEELERALVERSTDLAFMGRDPLFEPLAGDPCFRVVQERLRTPRSEATD